MTVSANRIGWLFRTAAILLATSGGLRVPSVRADASAPRFELEGNALKVPGPVEFETGKDTLKPQRPQGDAALDHVKAYLDAKPYISLLRIEVHTDAQGVAAANQALSERRALAIARALVSKGVDCKRLLAVGFGETKPVADNATPEGRARNRRTMFVNAALRGHAIGGQPVDGGGRPAGDPCK